MRLQAMRNTRNSPFPLIRLNHVLSRWNIDRFDRFLELAEELAVDQVDVRAVERMTPTTGGEWNDPSFVAKVLALRPRFLEFCRRTGIHDAGYLRDQAGAIDLFNDRGERLTCRRPWDTVAIHANGEVRPCMSWTRPPLGTLARQTFEEIWNGEAAESLRREFDAVRPGIDCIYCTIKKDRQEPYDDFFYRMLANVP
jgi:radical SAM protein with 4Fe4S-binding SPASM domain